MTDSEFIAVIEQLGIVGETIRECPAYKDPFGAWVTHSALFKGTVTRDLEGVLFIELEAFERNKKAMVAAARQAASGSTPNYQGESTFTPDAIFQLQVMKELIEHDNENRQFIFAYREKSTPAWGWMKTTPILMTLQECDRATRRDIVFNPVKKVFEAETADMDVIQYQLIDYVEKKPVGKKFWIYDQSQIKAKWNAKYIIKHIDDYIFKRDRLEDVKIENVDIDDEDMPVAIYKLNSRLAEAAKAGEIFVCCQCKGHFALTKDAQKSFVNRGLCVPKRCYPCRAVNKKARIDQQAVEEFREMKREMLGGF